MYFKFIWRRILIPVYIKCSYTHKYLFNYIINVMKRRYKLNFSFVDILSLGLHPYQLIGSTTLLLYARGTYKDILGEIFPLAINSYVAINSIKILKPYEIILYNITFNYYHYIDPIKKELSDIIIDFDKETLDIYNYPYNLIKFKKQRIDNDYNVEDRDDNIMGVRYNLSYWSEELKKYIELFTYIACNKLINPFNKNLV